MATIKTDSVVGGGAAIMLARALGMGFSFVLFLLLARNSETDAGIFRTVVTFLMVSEFLGLLGTHRWFAIELAPAGQRRQKLLFAGLILATVSAAVIALAFVAIAELHIYGAYLSHGILLVAAATFPSALLSLAQTSLIGIGQSKRMGWLNLSESAGRALVCIVLLKLGKPVHDIILVFIAFRWLVALFGIMIVVRALRPQRGWTDIAVARESFARIPRFAAIMVSFLVMRNASLLMLPALTSTREASIFAVPFQIYDLGLLVPTILALSSNYYFARQATLGQGPLLWAVVQLWSLTSMYLLPLVALAFVFGDDLLRSIFGEGYHASLPALYALTATMLLVALDQVLSQTMQAGKRYRADSRCITAGAVVAVLATVPLAERHGAAGAAMALLLAVAVVVMLRLWLLRQLVSPALVARVMQGPLLLSSGLAVMMFASRKLAFQVVPEYAIWAWLPASLAGLLFYLFMLRHTRILSIGKRARLRKFLHNRHVSPDTEVV